MKNILDFVYLKYPALLVLHSNSSKFINESMSEYDDWLNDIENTHIGNDIKEQEDRLRELQPIEHITHQVQLHHYTRSSRILNKSLYTSYMEKRIPESKIAGFDLKKLDEVVKRPINEFLTIYSGIHYNPQNIVKEAHLKSSGKVLFPAYTSTSIKKYIAGHFSLQNRWSKNQHIIKFHIEPHHLGTYIGEFSEHPFEKELLLPRNTLVYMDKKPNILKDISNRVYIWNAHLL